MLQDNTKRGQRVNPRRPARTLNAAVLVGGCSRRMGADKAGILVRGRTLLERTVDMVRPYARHIAIVGENHLADQLADLELLDVYRLPDARCGAADRPAAGPIAGVIAALRCAPDCDWLVLGCDMPAAGREALRWLIGRHRPDAHVTAARLPRRAAPEPLLAIYTPAAVAVLAASLAAGDCSLRGALNRMRPNVHEPPPALAAQWANINTPEQLGRYLCG